MRNKKLLLTILVLLVVGIIILYMKYINRCEGCDSCNYESFRDTVYVSYLNLSNDDIKSIVFKSKLDSNHFYEMYNEEYEVLVGKRLDDVDINNLSKIYIINGDRILEGTCNPYIIKSIKKDF